MFDAFDRQLTDRRLSYSALSALFVGGFGKNGAPLQPAISTFLIPPSPPRVIR
jgi:hypothetical protein